VKQRAKTCLHHQVVEDYACRNNMEMNNNPSPGNKLGGLYPPFLKNHWRCSQAAHNKYPDDGL
jgi:hypothetical protein